MPSLRLFSTAAGLLLAAACPAAPLSKSLDVDFHADVISRNLQGMATRSDGRLLPGPAVDPVNVNLGNTLLWSLAADGDKLLIGTGPEGEVLSVDPNTGGSSTPVTLLDLPETHVFSVLRLPSGDLLAGTSPQGTLVLARAGRVVARTALPVDSVFDLVLLPGDDANPAVLVATGNPGRIYHVDLVRFAASGDHADKVTASEALAARGISPWGEIRDRNVRRLLRLPDGRLIAGSAPKGNVYEFTATGGAPRILLENRNAEVSDLLPWADGFYAAVTYAAATGELRVNPPRASKPEEAAGAPTGAAEPPPVILPETPSRPDRFAGRSQLFWFPDGGFPETVAARNNVAFYRLARQGDQILIAGGEQGELLGYDPKLRRSLAFPGVGSAQLNGLLPAANTPGAYYAIANNPTGLHRVSFSGATLHAVETRRLDLGVPATLGLLRFGRGTKLDSDRLQVAMRVSFGSDETEGWSPWLPASAEDGGWRVPGLRGRHVQVRLTAQGDRFEIDRAELHYLPQNRRPQLQEFRLLAPHFGLLPAPAQAEPAVVTLGQLLQPPGREEEKQRTPPPASQVLPLPGAQVAIWTLMDPDGDQVTSTFSLRPVGGGEWTDLAVATPESFLQFDISHLAEGIYQTRLVATETAPRPAADRLSAVFETDDLLVDRSAPVLGDVQAGREAGRVRVAVTARDAFSLLAGAEFALNNGVRQTVEQPDDGILDGRSETFTLDLPADMAAGASSIEIIVYDALGNSAARRVPCP